MPPLSRPPLLALPQGAQVLTRGAGCSEKKHIRAMACGQHPSKKGTAEDFVPKVVLIALVCIPRQAVNESLERTVLC